MGSFFSKPKKKKNKGSESNSDVRPAENGANLNQEQDIVIDKGHVDRIRVEGLKRQLKYDLETFVVNHILMSVMFFYDYEKEIRELASNPTSKKEKEINSVLTETRCKRCYLPDVVMERVNQKVKYQHNHGLNKGLVEPIVPQRMFVVHENIQAVGKFRESDEIIDRSLCTVEVESSRMHNGFVQLKLLETTDTPRSSEESIYSHLPNDIYQSKPSTSAEEAPSSSTIRSNDSGVNSESDYEYIKITATKTPGKLEISERNIYTDAIQLPSSCKIAVRVKNNDSDDEEEDKPKFYRTHHYLNSNEFMSYFKRNIFPNSLGEILGFSLDFIQNANSIPGIIFCKSSDGVNFEIFPSILVSRYDQLENEMSVMLRRNPETLNPDRWLTNHMLEKIKEESCMAVSKGFTPKRGKNLEVEQEWEMAYPKIEHYLETRMSHEQMRVFLYLLVLHKKFIESVTSRHGLLVEHIRTHIFWECEQNKTRWPPHKLGKRLLEVLKSLHQKLGEEKLNNFFIKDKNEFEDIPGKYLRYAQDRIHEIIESPALYVLSALKHLRYVSKKFYPELDFSELYNILTSKSAVEELNPALYLSVEAQAQVFLSEEKKPKRELDKEEKWERRRMEYVRRKKAKKLMEQKMQAEKMNLKSERKSSKDSTDVTLPLQNFDSLLLQGKLLTFFIEHFLQLAKKSYRLSTTNQMSFYLNQAYLLVKILEETDYESAETFYEQISFQENRCKNKDEENISPPIPKRNSYIQFQPTTTLKLPKSQSEIRMWNLKQSFDANVADNQSNPSTSSEITKTAVDKKAQEVFKKKTKVGMESEIEKKIKSNALKNEGVFEKVGGLKVKDKERFVRFEVDHDGGEEKRDSTTL